MSGKWAIPVIASILILGVLASAPGAAAVPITIDDPSFESQTLVDGAFTSGGPDTFWVFDPSTGYFNPTASHLTPEAFDVENTAYSNGGEICQELGAITTNTLYALSVYVADRKDTPFPGYDIELRDASDESVLASIDETTGNPPADDAWAENTLELTILNGNASIGNNLKICLSSDGTQTNFDLVSLDATSISLPNGGTSRPIGGTLIPIDMISLFLTATQMNVVNYNEDFQVPSWFVTVEKWFKDGKISDSEFSKATQYLKNTNIITEIQTELKSAAIIDQIHDSIPNPEFQQKVKQYMQESGYKVDIYTTDDITVDFYKKLPSMNYDFIYIRTHGLEDLTSEQPTFLFTGEKYDIEKHTNEQQLGQVAKGSPIYEQELSEILKNKESLTDKTYFLIGSKMIDELMVGTFPQSVIIIGGCESLGSYDLANSLIDRGASAVIGWDSTINSDENDEVMLSFLEMILSENYDIPDAARLINEKYSPDMEFSSKLKGAFNSEYNYLLE